MTVSSADAGRAAGEPFPEQVLVPAPVPEDGGPEIAAKAVEGYIDHIGERRIYGWAWCRSQPHAALQVQIRLRERTLATVSANIFRRDLEKAGAGDGRHGFNVTLDEPVVAADRAEILAVVRCGPDGPDVPLVNRTLPQPASAAPPAPAGEAVAAATGGAAVPAASVAASLAAVSGSGAAGTSAAAGISDIRPVMRAIATLQRSVEGRLARLAAAAGSASEEAGAGPVALAGLADDVRGVRQDLAGVAGALEVMQARLDGVCASLADGTSARSPTRGDRGLLLIVAGLAAVSCAAFVLGLIAVFG